MDPRTGKALRLSPSDDSMEDCIVQVGGQEGDALRRRLCSASVLAACAWSCATWLWHMHMHMHMLEGLPLVAASHRHLLAAHIVPLPCPPLVLAAQPCTPHPTPQALETQAILDKMQSHLAWEEGHCC